MTILLFWITAPLVTPGLTRDPKKHRGWTALSNGSQIKFEMTLYREINYGFTALVTADAVPAVVSAT